MDEMTMKTKENRKKLLVQLLSGADADEIGRAHV